MPTDLPEGFLLDDDSAAPVGLAELPEGFVIDPDPPTGEEYARDLAKSVVRGATSEGVQMAAEGVYRGLAENIAPTDRDQQLREEVQGGQQQFIKAADNTALVPDAQAALTAGAEDRITRANEEMVARRTPGTPENEDFQEYENSPATQVADTLRTFADEAASQRQAVREALPVSQAVSQSIPGQLAQGAGQLINAPAYIVPGVGPAISVAQLYQEGYDDYVNTRTQQGLEVIPSEANAAASTYAAAAGPIDVLVDSLPAGQALKALVGKAPIRQALAEIGKIALAGGASEGFQQATLNTIASQLAEYDPDRPLTQDVLNSVIIGGAVSGVGAAGAEVAGRVSAPQQVKSTKVLALDTAAIKANEANSPLVAKELSKQANTLQQTPANIVAPEATEAERRARQEEILDELDTQEEAATGDDRFAPPVVEQTVAATPIVTTIPIIPKTLDVGNREINELEIEENLQPQNEDNWVAAPAVPYFRTQKGSVYEVDGNSTRRTKAKGIKEKDDGLKDASEVTVYVSNQGGRDMAMFQSLSANGRRIQLDPDTNTIQGTYPNERTGNRKGGTYAYRYSTTPQVGLVPVELWKSAEDGYRGWHPGHPIIEISNPTQSNQPEKAVAAAYLTNKGRQIVAPTHAQAFDLVESGQMQLDPNETINENVEGFVTNTGRFVNREEAAALNQVTNSYQGEGQMGSKDLMSPADRAAYDARTQSLNEQQSTGLDEPTIIDTAETPIQEAGIQEQAKASQEAQPQQDLANPRDFKLNRITPPENVTDWLQLRETRKNAELQLLQEEIGITPEQANRLHEIAFQNEGNADRWAKRTLTPEQYQKYDDFFESNYNSKDGPVDFWEYSQGNRFDPAEIQDATSIKELGEDIVRAFTDGAKPGLNDKWIYTVAAIQKLLEVGGTREDISDALRLQAGRMAGSQSDAEFWYSDRGKQINDVIEAFAPTLPLEESPQTQEKNLLSSNNNENTRSTDSGGVREAIQPTVAESQAVPNEGQNQPTQRVQIGSSPQTHVVVEELPQSSREVELNEKYFRIRNERTGEEQTVEQNDMRFVKGKAAETALKPEIDAAKARIDPLTSAQKDSVFSLNNEAGGVLIPNFQDIQDAFTNIASSLNQAYDNFTDWSGAMVRNFGNGVVKFLQRIYNFLNTGAGRIPANQLQAGAINIPFLNPANPNSKSTRQPFRKVQKDARYKPEGKWSAAGRWNKEIFNFLGQKERNVSANLNATEYLAAQLKRERAKAEKAGTPISSDTLNISLGNTDNHLTDVQFQEARAIRDPETRAAFELTAKLENQANARIAQQEALDSLPEPIRDFIVEMRTRIDQLSHDLRTSGAISGDIEAAIDDNLGLYLHRSYSIFDNAEAWKDFISSDDADAVAVRNKAEALFQDYAKADAARVLLNNSREAGTPITRQEALDQLNGLDFSEEGARLLEDYLSVADDGEKSILGGRLPGAKNRSIVTLRGQIPQEIRDLWGEQKDATTNFAKTYASMSAFLENDKFLKNVLKDGLITAQNPNGYIWKEGESEGLRPRGFTQLVGDGSKTMEPLNGAWMPPELVEAFTTYYQGQQNNNALLRFFQAATGLSMKSKTAWSWASTMRNFFGNIAFMTANGNLDITKLSDAKDSAWANLTKGGEKEIRDRIENYIRLGVVGDNVGPQLIKEITAAANLEKTGDKLTRGHPIITKLWNAGKATDKLATDIYSSVDDFWKVFAFENELNKIKQAYPNETQEQQEVRAANIVRDTVPTYSLAPEIVRNMKSNFGVVAAPFITFTTEVLRTTYNTVKTGVNEIKESQPKVNIENGVTTVIPENKALKSIGIKRLASFAATMSFLPALAVVFKQLFDYDDEDEDALRKFLPEWQKNAQLLLLDKDDKGNPRYIDVSFLDPYGYLKEPIIAAIVQSRSGKSADEIAQDATIATLSQIAEPFLTEQILAGSIMDVARNTNASGGQVYNPQDKLERKTYDQIAHVLGTFTPGTLTSLGRIYRGVTNQVSPTGRAYDAGNELSSFFLGQRVSSVDPQTSLDFATRQYKAQNQDATSLLNRVLKSRGTIPEGSIVERYEAANIAKQRLVQELRDKYKSAMTLGTSEKDARRILDDASLGKDALREVINGEYRKYQPSTQTLNDVRKNFPERIVELNQAISSTPDTVPLR